ncbi:hypothetical protein [Stutzerimonas stutzeri]|uniref:Curli assembly protein CsgC n=1 Tax=Stutzerimonas stutzeri TaxID=316 RepID=A0AA40RP15_STUST|nr:hypothetical protein [Stutzerimonas stutzeri]MBA1303106.1 hypothetical protein [Stutzerimonas stutzeri]
MLVMTLAPWLLAAAAAATTDAPVQVRLDLQPAAAEQRLTLSLCFKGSGQQVRYRLKVRSSGTAGTGQTTQSGILTAGESEQCPLRNRLGIAADTAVEAELQWWIDDQEQPTLLERYPPRGGDSDEEPDPDQPQQLA